MRALSASRDRIFDEPIGEKALRDEPACIVIRRIVMEGANLGVDDVASLFFALSGEKPPRHSNRRNGGVASHVVGVGDDRLVPPAPDRGDLLSAARRDISRATDMDQISRRGRALRVIFAEDLIRML